MHHSREALRIGNKINSMVDEEVIRTGISPQSKTKKKKNITESYHEELR